MPRHRPLEDWIKKALDQYEKHLFERGSRWHLQKLVDDLNDAIDGNEPEIIKPWTGPRRGPRSIAPHYWYPGFDAALHEVDKILDDLNVVLSAPVYVNRDFEDWSTKTPEQNFEATYGTFYHPEDDELKERFAEFERGEISEKEYEREWNVLYELYVQDWWEIDGEDAYGYIFGRDLYDHLRSLRWR